MAGEGLFEKIEKIKMHFRILILVGTVGLLGGLFIYFFIFPRQRRLKRPVRILRNSTGD